MKHWWKSVHKLQIILRIPGNGTYTHTQYAVIFMVLRFTYFCTGYFIPVREQNAFLVPKDKINR